jgi:predicted ATPase/transcriptional regulator with XRE-family HTH domain
MTGPISRFGSELKRRRKTLGLTQLEVADRVGCSEITIRMLETGQRRPSRQLATLLARLLELTGSDFEAFMRLARLRNFDDVEDGNLQPSAVLDPHPRTPHNLPPEFTPLIGRESAILAVAERLARDDTRLLTLTGPPGVGKTRLAVRVAYDLLDRFPDGVIYVALASVRDPDLFAPTVARTLKLKDDPSVPALDMLQQHLRGKQLLLVLDNFEQLLGLTPAPEGTPYSFSAARQVAGLVAACEGLKILITSREALRVRSERQYSVPPLSAPDLSAPAAPSELAGNPSVALFLEHSTMADPGFALTRDNAADVAAICARLEGLPLAIELVASRIQLMSPRSLLARLPGPRSRVQGYESRTGASPRGYATLDSGAWTRDSDERHQTLRSAIGWSYDLLSDDERALFRRLGSFAGGWALPAAEAVCNAHANLSIDMLQGLSSLLDKNLLKRVEVEGADIEPRFSMLETIREYALERLEESAEPADVHRVHAEYFLAMAEAALPRIMGMGDQVWLDRLEQDYDNMRAALDWALQSGHAEIALGLGGALGFFWEIRNYFTEGIDYLSRALALYSEQTEKAGPTGKEPDPLPARARALWVRGRLRLFLSDETLARKDYEESLVLYQRLSDRWGMAATLVGSAYLSVFHGEYTRAYTELQEALRLRRELGYRVGEANTLWSLGFVLGQMGELDRAVDMLEQGLEIGREVGSKYVLAGGTRDLAEVLALKGDLARAADLYMQSIPLFREIRDPEALLWALTGLGYVRLRQDDRVEAEELFRESLELARELGTRKRISHALEGLAAITVQQALEDPGEASNPRSSRRLHRAARLLGAAQALRESGLSPLPLSRRAEHDDLVRTLATMLAEPAFTAEWQAGSSMSFTEAITYALEGNYEL